MDATLRKQKGVHYTPPGLAQFLARQTASCMRVPQANRVTILDPACGDGGLLAAMIDSLQGLPEWSGVEIAVVGYETDPEAVARTRRRLESMRLVDIQINNEDFLESKLDESFDCVIANPPYVRTQVLGGVVARRLASKFHLSGRVDLYQAFAFAISEVLSPGGALGLLTSNRFLTVQSGATMRQLLAERFHLKKIFDLGDTRLFEASVLPVIVNGVRRDGTEASKPETEFHRIYQVENSCSQPQLEQGSMLDCFEDNTITGEVETADGRFMIQRGELLAGDSQSVWTMANAATRAWLQTVRMHQSKSFGDLAEIKVGIKTTADAVFIREDWDSLDCDKPDPELLLPLITHHDAGRWAIETPKKTVLYPYDRRQAKRTPVDLSEFPRTAAYLLEHRERLEGRRYVVESGRHWYEIWVSHQPADWAKAKIVWPDISDQPKFFLDERGAIVNGDCYWIKLREGVDADWLYMMLAIANSSVATTFYDTVFHNKLYAGRRRYMTQYVKDFPLPELDSEIGASIVKLVKKMVNQPTKTGEVKLEKMVLEAFGLPA